MYGLPAYSLHLQLHVKIHLAEVQGLNSVSKLSGEDIIIPPQTRCLYHVTLRSVWGMYVTAAKIRNIIGTNLLTKFHEDRKINVASRVLTRKNAPPPGSHVFQPTGIIFKLVQDIIGMNFLTRFHYDWTINVASRVKNAPPLGSHVFQAKVTIFELSKDISGTNLLSKFHEDRKLNVASRVLTRKYALPPGGHVFQPTGIIF
ncbi:hypothetical protein DPMN_071795 [Dreissena polymorpha]|uniref:Uncharacterized protein n=1 Tax=Dreissena polymorpha TaxID=45954 RepID=A0A9D3Z7A2_DREPO|nr:hypothetical protein DPMN_071795 [Dreissena polymorpha]